MLCLLGGLDQDDVLYGSGMPMYHSAAGMIGIGIMVVTGEPLSQ